MAEANGRGPADVWIELAGTAGGGPALVLEKELGSAPVADGAAGTPPAWHVRQMRGEAGSYLLLRYAGASRHVEFLLYPGGRQVRVTWTDGVRYSDVASLFIGPVLATLLWVRGAVCLHGSALAADGQAIALLGQAGAGKSTTAAALARRGLAVLADDVTVLTEDTAGLMVQPGCPRVWLRPAAAPARGARPEDMPDVLLKAGKRQLDLAEADTPWRFERLAQPLAAIYLLGGREAGRKAPALTRVPQAAAMRSLIANRYSPQLLDQKAGAHMFSLLGQAAQRVPVRHLARPDNLDTLPQLSDLILDDLRALRAGA